MVEIVVFNHAIGPEPLNQLIFTQEVPVVFDKEAEGVEDLSTKRNQLARTQQAAFRDIQLERFETKNHSPPFTKRLTDPQAAALNQPLPTSRLYLVVTPLPDVGDSSARVLRFSLRLGLWNRDSTADGSASCPEVGSEEVSLGRVVGKPPTESGPVSGGFKTRKPQVDSRVGSTPAELRPSQPGRMVAAAFTGLRGSRRKSMASIG